MIIEEINILNKEYPQSLKNIYEPPEILYCLGDIKLLNNHKIAAVVGTRNMSEYGKRVIEKLVPKMVKMGLVIVSGMAYGVDAYAAKVCIESGGKTIAVLASGVDEPTPKGNIDIYNSILENGGLVVSENKSGYWLNKKDFLKRNRIVAGIGESVLVIEAGIRSGSLATARLALEIGKEVMAVPGRIDEENSEGTNWLIKNGARLIEGAEDIVDTGVIIKG